MEVKKIYLDPDLTLWSLAEELSIASHRLSQLLNDVLNRNYNDYVNSYRIEEAKRIFDSPKGAGKKIPWWHLK